MNALLSSPCDQLRTLLDSATDEAALATMIAEHLADCPDCAHAERVMTHLAAQLRAADRTDTLPPEVEARLLAWLGATGSAKPPARG